MRLGRIHFVGPVLACLIAGCGEPTPTPAGKKDTTTSAEAPDGKKKGPISKGIQTGEKRVKYNAPSADDAPSKY
jgi:hypothetical protein